MTGIAAVATTACWVLPAPFWVAELAIYALPLAYLLATSPTVRQSISFSFWIKATLFCAVFFTYVGIHHGGWTGPSALPRIFEVPIEQALWGALAIPLMIAVDQRFFARGEPTARVPGARRLVYLLFAAGLALALVPPLRALMDGHVYLKIGLIIYPLLLLLAARLGRPVVREMVCVGIVFTLPNLAFELLGMHHGYWGYRGDYVGWVGIGDARFPLEELLFIVVLSAPGVVAAHALRWHWKGTPRPPRPR